jgi:hypothetical protein
VQRIGEVVRLSLEATDPRGYSNAQLDDYHQNGQMMWQPPVRLFVRVRFSHPQARLGGTAGFGFWNDPFGMTKSVRPLWPSKMGQNSSWLPRIRLPQAAWYCFASPPSEMLFAQGVPGFGWKAATLDASRPLARVLLPFAPLGMLACRWSWLYRRLWPLAQHVLKIDEALVPVAMDAWHDYCFVWESDRIRFFVDDEVVFNTRFAPRGPLGFVAWIDNQYMVATPQGRLRHGVVATGAQWMELASLQVATLN